MEGRKEGRMRAGWQPTKLEPHTEMWKKRKQNHNPESGKRAMVLFWLYMVFSQSRLQKEVARQELKKDCHACRIFLKSV